ncbi:type II toxin-antitoxin system RelE family toxin [Methanolobus halotolerans]|uniref:type II toxin-antitoxin system RelE family toxin n=1 Tax=Methanolobus halotolerans TaxID=2052935 RepID=UPI001F3C2382|nr:type II toxin-antitoxin system RelE/ParE family toxin [Methanolobus halotolerans]
MIDVSYSLFISSECKKEIKKLTRKNVQLENILEKKIKDILENPTRFKPLRNELAGHYRVHIMTSFVLIFTVDLEERTVSLVHFSHHDDAYKR